METETPTQPRHRRKRQRPSEGGNTANPVNPAPVWAAPAGPQAVHHGANPADDTTVQPPTFPSQQLDRSHQVAVGVAVPEPNALMNGYTTPHSQYQDPPSLLTGSNQPPDPSGLGSLNTVPSNNNQPRASAAASKNDRVLYQQYGAAAGKPGPDSPANIANATPGSAYNLSSGWSRAMPQSPATGVPSLAPPPEGIYRTFEDLLQSVQQVAKDQGYGVVKLRASNYRDKKATRYDLVCDRGGVKYNSTAQKRKPSTRKVDCPWRAKAVCEVQLGYQWRFVVQESKHNHEPRVPSAPPGQENTPMAQSLRSLTNKIDRLAHDMAHGLNRIEARLENVEKRLDRLEGSRRPQMMGGPGGPNMANTMPTAAMGTGSMGNGPMTNGGMAPGPLDSELSAMQDRVDAMERGMGLPMMDDESSRLSMMVT